MEKSNKKKPPTGETDGTDQPLSIIPSIEPQSYPNPENISELSESDDDDEKATPQVEVSFFFFSFFIFFLIV